MGGTATGYRCAMLVLLLLLLPACAARPPAPIEDHTRGVTPRGDRYTVLRGDTLYSISFRYGLDFRRMASANNIAAPYTIYPGQVLKLAEAPVRVARAETKSRNRSAPSSPASSTRSSSAPSASTTTPKTTAKKAPASRPPGTGGSSATNKADGWRWPVAGRVSRRFDSSLHKGIDISGDRGERVVATAAGRVVYAGTGIAGYGLMLILRHDDVYLSAYGHNDELLVTEGDEVRAGQAIARRGSSGTDAVKLHFEIRRNGRPVDPLTLLPAR